MSIAIYPGSFDPLTNGHLDVALRAARIFDTLILAIYEGSHKPGAMFPIPERIRLAQEAIANCNRPCSDRIVVKSFSGLAVEYARTEGANTIVRGLRAISDFEYEFQYAHMNEHLAPEIEVVSLMTASRYSFISSSFIREVAGLGGSLEGLVPDNVERALRHQTGRPDDAPVLSGQQT